MLNLNIIYCNANGITKKLIEIQILTSTRKIDIILLIETRISPKTTIKLPNDRIYYYDLPPKYGSPAHGETTIYVHCQIIYQQEYLNTKLKSISIKIKIDNNVIFISAIYKLHKVH